MSKQNGRASEKLLDELHGMQAETLLAIVQKMSDGELEPSPALLAQVNKFLKDNGVDRAVRPGDATDLLSDQIDDFMNNNALPFAAPGEH